MFLLVYCNSQREGEKPLHPHLPFARLDVTVTIATTRHACSPSLSSENCWNLFFSSVFLCFSLSFLEMWFLRIKVLSKNPSAEGETLFIRFPHKKKLPPDSQLNKLCSLSPFPHPSSPPSLYPPFRSPMGNGGFSHTFRLKLLKMCWQTYRRWIYVNLCSISGTYRKDVEPFFFKFANKVSWDTKCFERVICIIDGLQNGTSQK